MIFPEYTNYKNLRHRIPYSKFLLNIIEWHITASLYVLSIYFTKHISDKTWTMLMLENFFNEFFLFGTDILFNSFCKIVISFLFHLAQDQSVHLWWMLLHNISALQLKVQMMGGDQGLHCFYIGDFRKLETFRILKMNQIWPK